MAQVIMCFGTRLAPKRWDRLLAQTSESSAVAKQRFLHRKKPGPPRDAHSRSILTRHADECAEIILVQILDNNPGGFSIPFDDERDAAQPDGIFTSGVIVKRIMVIMAQRIGHFLGSLLHDEFAVLREDFKRAIEIVVVGADVNGVRQCR